jgi:hypothetical protein
MRPGSAGSVYMLRDARSPDVAAALIKSEAGRTLTGSTRPFGPVEGYALLPGRGILRPVDSRYSRTHTLRTPLIPAIRLSQMPGERDTPALHSV